MFYLFILESIGTSELMLIGLVALIVFGPRKLPELAKTLGKAMNEFRRSTDEFKRTWEKEVEFESSENKNLIAPVQSPIANASTIQRENTALAENVTAAPSVREIKQADFEKSFTEQATQAKTPTVESTNKQDWL